MRYGEESWQLQTACRATATKRMKKRKKIEQMRRNILNLCQILWSIVVRSERGSWRGSRQVHQEACDPDRELRVRLLEEFAPPRTEV